MELDAIKAHKQALADHIATWLLDFSTKTGVPVSLKAEPVYAEGETNVEKPTRYDVTLTGFV